MGRKSASSRGGTERRAAHDRLHGHDASDGVDHLADRLGRIWNDFPEAIVESFEERFYVLRHRSLAHYEHVACSSVLEHQNVALIGVQAFSEKDKRSGRMLGHCVMFRGAPVIHRYLNYVSLSFSGPTDIRLREGRVLFNDDQFCRLWCFGVGTFDYLFCNRKVPDFMKPKSGTILVGDGAAHSRYAGQWNEGI